MKYLMGIDNGGTAVKAAIYDEKGNQISVDNTNLDMIKAHTGWTERNLNDLFTANINVIKNAIQKSNIDSKNIVAVAISGHGKGLYLLDKNKNPLYNGIISTDNRATEYEKNAYITGVADRIYNKTYQKVLACQPVCLLQWLKDNNRQVYDNIGYILSVKDYIRFMLTDEIYTEIADISGTNLYNLKTNSYDKDLLKEFNIEEIKNCLPKVKNSADICGKITKKVAEKTGLKEGTIVAGGTFDIDACAIGMGITNSDNVCVIAGTWSINEYISKTPVVDKSISMNSFYVLPDFYLIEECSPTSAGNLEWFLNNFYTEEKIKYKKDFYKIIDKQVENISPEQSDIIFLPFIFASNEDINLKSAFYNVIAKTTKCDMLRAVFEGIVFSHKSHIDKLLSSRNAPYSIRLGGGAANSDIWAQMFADIMQIKIETVTNSEQGCFGAAIIAGVASKVYENYKDAVNKTVKISKTYIPDTNKAKIYKEKYNNYKKLVECLKNY